LSVVSIVLDPDDNPHLVFESLNAKGRALSAADLIRNYFFMRIHVNDQDDVYDKYWKPMEAALHTNLTECIRHYLMKDGKVVRRDDVYFILKDGVTKDNAIERLTDLARFAGYYERLLNPVREFDPDIKAAIERFNRLETNSAFPFLLNCFEDYHGCTLSKSDLIEVFRTLENFVVRRFVCNIATKYLSTIFPALYHQAKKLSGVSFPRALCLVLQNKGYPRDAEFRSRLVDGKLYGSADRALKTKLILETFEASYCHKEKISFPGLTLEHLMPQTLTQSWKSALGKDWQEVHELYLHTIGNLSLTGYNSELSNSDWNSKRVVLLESNLELNRYFANKESWKREDIEQRSRDLSEMAVRAWPYFGDGSVAETVSVTGTTPSRLKILGQSFDVDSWRDVLEHTLNVISDLEPEKFDVLLKQFPRFISRQSGSLREHRQLKNGVYIEVNLSAQTIQKFCFQAIESIDLSTDDLIVQSS